MAKTRSPKRRALNTDCLPISLTFSPMRWLLVLLHPAMPSQGVVCCWGSQISAFEYFRFVIAQFEQECTSSAQCELIRRYIQYISIDLYQNCNSQQKIIKISNKSWQCLLIVCFKWAMSVRPRTVWEHQTFGPEDRKGRCLQNVRPVFRIDLGESGNEH